jgi:hypothetical protein
VSVIEHEDGDELLLSDDELAALADDDGHGLSLEDELRELLPGVQV